MRAYNESINESIIAVIRCQWRYADNKW